MRRKSLLITALCVSSVSLTGCASTMSTAWSSLGDLVNGVTEVTKSAFLRGFSKKDDVSFADAEVQEYEGVYKTEVGEYVPADVEVAANTDFEVDVSETNDLKVEIYDDADLDVEIYDDYADTAEAYVDTSPVPCPDGTYLNAKDECMYLETEEFDFGTEVNMVEPVIDTSPVPCPEGTYLNAKNECMHSDPLDFAASIETGTPINVEIFP